MRTLVLPKTRKLPVKLQQGPVKFTCMLCKLYRLHFINANRKGKAQINICWNQKTFLKSAPMYNFAVCFPDYLYTN